MNLKGWLLVVLMSFSWVNIASADAGDVAYDKKDYSEAFRIWKPKADDGDAVAQHNVGHLYGRGYGVLKDETKAVKWFEKAAYGGFAKSQHFLAKHNIAECSDTGGYKSIRQISKQCLKEARFWVENLYNNDDKTYKARAEELWNKYELSKYSAPVYMKNREEKSQTLFDKVKSFF